MQNKKTKGYINILWYQHNEQGIKFIISEKKRLPRVAINEIKKDKKIKVELEESNLIEESKDIKIKLPRQLLLLILHEQNFLE